MRNVKYSKSNGESAAYSMKILFFYVGIEQTPDTVQEKGNYSYSLNGVANLLKDETKQSTSSRSMQGDGQIKLSKLFHELCDAQKLNLVTLTTQKARA